MNNNITLGNWNPTGSTAQKRILDNKYTAHVISNGYGIVAEAVGKTREEAEAQAKLIADAGNTYLKCGMLPSELLKMNELKLAVKKGMEAREYLMERFEIEFPDTPHQKLGQSIPMNEVMQWMNDFADAKIFEVLTVSNQANPPKSTSGEAAVLEEPIKLTSENVHNTYINCLFKPGEPTEIHTIGEGLRLKVRFHPERLKEAEPLIIEMLDGLPDAFKKTDAGGGGGWSFLNMCLDKEGNHWAEQQQMEELVALGTALGKMAFITPRDMWEASPGGVPYLVVN